MYVGTEMRLEALGVAGVRRRADVIQDDLDLALELRKVCQFRHERRELDRKIEAMRTNLALAEFYIDQKETELAPATAARGGR